MIDLFHDFIGVAMVVGGAFGLGWYWRWPPVYGRIRGVAGRTCNDG